MLLALDTATQFASIALYDDDVVLAELSWRSERRHTVELASQVDALLQLAGRAPTDIRAIAVAIGPGSYTGTRVAVSFAKGIVVALDVPLISVPTLDVLAYPHLSGASPLCALVQAGRSRYCWALYAPGSEQPQRLGDWGLAPISDILQQTSPPLRFAGELRPEDAAFLRQTWDAGAILIPPALATRRAGVLAALAYRRWQNGDVDEAAALSPIYLS